MMQSGKKYLTINDPYPLGFDGDSVAMSICVSNWGDGKGVTADDLASVSSLDDKFSRQSITNTKWLMYFTGITELPNNAFNYCQQLTELVLPDWIISIPYYGFAFCTSLLHVLLGQNLSSIGKAGFYSCRNVIDFTVNRLQPPVLATDTSLGMDTSKVTIYVPTIAVSTYRETQLWKSYRIQGI